MQECLLLLVSQLLRHLYLEDGLVVVELLAASPEYVLVVECDTSF